MASAFFASGAGLCYNLCKTILTRPEEMNMHIYDDKIPLEVKLDLPAGRTDDTPLMILLHGFTGHMEEPHITAMAEMMTGLGFAVLRAELYGHGRSGGTFHDHTIWKWLNNIMTLVDYARGELGYKEIWLAGHSQGGLSVLLAAAMERDRIKGVVALAPAVTIPAWARNGSAMRIDFDPVNVPDSFDLGEVSLGGNYIRAAQMIHAEDAFRYEGPVIFVHGDADETIPVTASVEFSKHFRDAELVLIPGDTHCYDHHLDQALAAVRDWLIRKR